MSEKKEPFDAVINELRGVIGEAEETGIWDDLIGECKAAIRVLKAAGKVDKEGGLKFIHACGYPIFPYPKNARQICALIESLPEKEE